MDVRRVDVIFYEQGPLPKDLLRELIWRYSEEGDRVTSFNGPDNYFGECALDLCRRVIIFCGGAPCNQQVEIIREDCQEYFQVESYPVPKNTI